jgi:hypothetical protein
VIALRHRVTTLIVGTRRSEMLRTFGEAVG